MNVLLTGGSGKLGSAILNARIFENIYAPSSQKLDITERASIKRFLNDNRVDAIIHCAAQARIVKAEIDPVDAINKNIIGTSNMVSEVLVFNKKTNKNIRFAHVSTDGVYSGAKGNYEEDGPTVPTSNYGWSKLGGESAVQMYKNSLILRLCMTEKPFIHKYAFSNVNTNFMFHEDFAKIFYKLINKKGIINVGGIRQTVFNFAKSKNKNVKKKISNGLFLDQSMNIKKFENIIS